ncbi:hypothetical protein TNCV_1718721 [Trichonephila clavipes]|nr:hypothetical protein TNCV_1718721 [Trichonephila clavipes]
MLDIFGKWNAKRSSIPYRNVLRGLEMERPELRGSFLVDGLEGARGYGYDDCFGVSGRKTRLLLVDRNQ